jgi:hypothetical protein
MTQKDDNTKEDRGGYTENTREMMLPKDESHHEG